MAPKVSAKAAAKKLHKAAVADAAAARATEAAAKAVKSMGGASRLAGGKKK